MFIYWYHKIQYRNFNKKILNLTFKIKVAVKEYDILESKNKIFKE